MRTYSCSPAVRLAWTLAGRSSNTCAANSTDRLGVRESITLRESVGLEALYSRTLPHDGGGGLHEVRAPFSGLSGSFDALAYPFRRGVPLTCRGHDIGRDRVGEPGAHTLCLLQRAWQARLQQIVRIDARRPACPAARERREPSRVRPDHVPVHGVPGTLWCGRHLHGVTGNASLRRGRKRKAGERVWPGIPESCI